MLLESTRICACGCGEVPKEGNRYVSFDHYRQRPPKPVEAREHGSSGYKHGCRCSDCIAWKRLSTSRETPRVMDKSTPPRTHGAAGYGHGCRCDICSAAKEAIARRWRAKYRPPHRQLMTAEERLRNRRASRMAWFKANLEVSRRMGRAYYAAHRAKRLAYSMQARHTPEGRAYTYAQRLKRRARIKKAPGKASASQITGRWAMTGGRCYLCGGTAVEMDHVIPLSRGGSNWPANLRPACRTCNLRKNNRPLREFLSIRAGE